MSTVIPETSFEQRTVGEMATNVPGAAGIFRRHRLDFCCRGDVSLADEATHRGIDAAEVVSELESLDRTVISDRPQSTNALIAHIIGRYHDSHRRELPELIRLAMKVEAVHEGHPAVPRGLSSILEGVESRLDAHMHKTERDLFPAMRKAIQVDERLLSELRKENDEHGLYVHRIESLTHGFQTPEGACRTWQALYTGVARFVEDAIEHVHLENNVLFPCFE